MDHNEWLEKYSRIKAAADRVQAMRQKRFSDLLHLAHIDNPMMLHNAMVSLNSGTPWKEVNYEAAKLAYYLENSGWLWYPGRIVSRWDARVRGYKAPEYTAPRTFKVDRQIKNLL